MTKNTHQYPILILDDDQDILGLLNLEFRNSPYKVHLCSTAEEAIEGLKSREYYFAFIDIILGPNQTSESVIEFIRNSNNQFNNNLPIVIMSAHMNDNYAKKLRQKNPAIIETLRKPITRGQALALLRPPQNNNVLILDDDSDVIRLIQLELEKAQKSCFSTEHINVALKLLNISTYSLIILDHKIGQNDSSKSVIDTIAERNIKTPIILTGKDIDPVLSERTDVNIIGIVQKPFKRNAFSKTLTFIENLFSTGRPIEEEQEKGADFNLISGSKQENKEVVNIKGHKEDPEHRQKVKYYHEDEELSILVKSNENNKDKDLTFVEGVTEHIDEGITKIESKELQDSEDRLELEILEKSIEQNIKTFDLKQRNSKGMTPLMIFSKFGDLKKVISLIEKGSQIGLRSKSGKSPIHYAAQSGNTEVVEYILESGGKINERDEQKREVLYEAIAKKNIEMATFLINKGARLTSRIHGQSYLHLSVKARDFAMTALLVKAGVDIKIKDNNGMDIFDWARKLKDKKTYLYLKSIA